MLIPANLSELSLNSATASLGIFPAIVTAFVLLYPFCDISYRIAIIFLISSIWSVFCILYKTNWELDTLMIILGIVTFILGASATILIDYFGNRKNNITELKTE